MYSLRPYLTTKIYPTRKNHSTILTRYQTLSSYYSSTRSVISNFRSSSSPLAALSVDNNVDGVNDLEHRDGVTHHSPTQILKNLEEIQFLKIELLCDELSIEDDGGLKLQGVATWGGMQWMVADSKR
ncbi:hypothetical protein L1887_03701 [Cichorium endivia]|nr:hypothetical protein L1887_03701 [Cichorium endivia]